jgi:hypothetical protein
MADARLHSVACERNREPILRILEQELPSRGLVLEIASGTGMHAAYFAAHLPNLVWQPSDNDDQALASIDAWRADERLDNLRPAIMLDVLTPRWPIEHADAVFNANMIHISPWVVCLAVFAGAARILDAGAPLILYGPFMMGGRHTAESNAIFDESLRARDPRWGVRDLDVVAKVARDEGFLQERLIAMPANNLIVIFRRVVSEPS